MDPQVSLVTVNSHLKNSPKEQREELKSQAIAKLDLIIKNGPWKQIEAIIDFISFAIDTDTKVRIIEDIIKCCTSLIGSALSL